MQIRKAKTIDELLHDRSFPYHVGQLIGSAEMASHWMRIHGDELTREMGEKLAESVGWFFRGGKEEVNGPKRDAEDTKVISRSNPQSGR